MYDIVGDVHGYAEQLEALLQKMGYRKTEGVWRHPERKLISVGDLIDRGPRQKESVDIIRAMHEADQALVIMGNHEFNAVAWATKDEEGSFLRSHKKKNREQHEEFLEVAEANPDWYASTIEWFKTLPLYLDLPELRVTHACWHEASKAVIEAYTDQRGALQQSAWEAANRKGHELYDAIEVMCKGWEIALPEGYSFLDHGEHERRAIRTQWWREDSRRYIDLALGVKDGSNLPEGVIDGATLPGYDNAKPLFVGHYWMQGIPELQASHIACVDWSVADPKVDGKMVAYRFGGENKLTNENFIWVDK
ncbi:metallophosphoesterase [Pseudidiomarina terrestris]|uniref:metallophosphoesterase n=1 Tax=Pseudidiomarina terrestris TaxID=2820060 RepID=UPI00264CC256|nr:metallophosphoesterase [Pseudidiomarina sp. 1ASP75-5]MDN7135375.1 metallophosphoesterase [Pseudidiomarina sp. 1ASP75-5]